MPTLLSESIADSRRFGLAVFRGNLDALTPPATIATEIEELRPDVVIFRCPAGEMKTVQHLLALSHIPIHADTLVYYSRQLGQTPAGLSAPGVAFERATSLDLVSISKVARRAFRNYRSHYHANPLFDTALVLDGYVEWAIDYLATTHDGRETWVIRNKGETVGFATCALDRIASSIEIVLNAVDPSAQGSGLYGGLLRAMIQHYGAEGFRYLTISTQVWNYVVQRAWSRAGFLISSAHDTWHVNAMFRHPERRQNV